MREVLEGQARMPHLDAYDTGEGYVVWCDFCGRLHEHGREGGHCLAHCGTDIYGAKSPYEDTGYVLVYDGKLTHDLRLHFARMTRERDREKKKEWKHYWALEECLPSWHKMVVAEPLLDEIYHRCASWSAHPEVKYCRMHIGLHLDEAVCQVVGPSRKRAPLWMTAPAVQDTALEQLRKLLPEACTHEPGERCGCDCRDEQGFPDGSVQVPWATGYPESKSELGQCLRTRSTDQGTGSQSRRSIHPRDRYLCYERDDYTCRYCGRHRLQLQVGEHLVIDHVHPVARGGSSDISNLVTACSTCNQGRGGVGDDVVRGSAG